MKVNPYVESKIREYIHNYLSKKKESSIGELIENYRGNIDISETEFRSILRNAIENENLVITEKASQFDKSIISLGKPFSSFDFSSNLQIVISRPKMSELGFDNVIFRNDQIETRDCIKNIIRSTKKYLWICSPFIDNWVISEEAFPELKSLFLDALEREVEITLLTREIESRGSFNIDWLCQLARDVQREDQLKIYDYHMDLKNRVFSSTHAKLVIADCERAYLGSAELRRNSLITNFEVGCYIEGPQVLGICEAFNLMLSKAREWKWE